MPGLRFDAPAYVPMSGSSSRSEPVDIPHEAAALPDDPWATTELELSVSPQELEELEEVESWVQLMTDLELEEETHMIEMALRYGDKKRIAEVKQRVAAVRREKAAKAAGHHGKKGHGNAAPPKKA